MSCSVNQSAQSFFVLLPRSAQLPTGGYHACRQKVQIPAPGHFRRYTGGLPEWEVGYAKAGSPPTRATTRDGIGCERFKVPISAVCRWMRRSRRRESSVPAGCAL